MSQERERERETQLRCMSDVDVCVELCDESRERERETQLRCMSDVDVCRTVLKCSMFCAAVTWDKCHKRPSMNINHSVTWYFRTLMPSSWTCRMVQSMRHKWETVSRPQCSTPTALTVLHDNVMCTHCLWLVGWFANWLIDWLIDWLII